MEGVGVPGGSNSKGSACDTRDLCSIPGSEKSLGEGNGNPLLYSCLENPMDRGAWRAAGTSMGSQRVTHDWATNTFTFTWKEQGLLPDVWSQSQHLPRGPGEENGMWVQTPVLILIFGSPHGRLNLPKPGFPYICSLGALSSVFLGCGAIRGICVHRGCVVSDHRTFSKVGQEGSRGWASVFVNCCLCPSFWVVEKSCVWNTGQPLPFLAQMDPWWWLRGAGDVL